jgi:hypothetical protein
MRGLLGRRSRRYQDNGAIVDNAIGVGTFDSAGNPADKAFHLVVTC